MMENTAIDRLLRLMAALRDPETGCAWDRVQTFASIAPHTIEEAYEVADAIQRGDLDDLRDELGDLLLQVVFHARIAQEAGAFSFVDVAEAISAKLIRRHPHVFDATGTVLAPEKRETDVSVITATWERIKAQERAAKVSRKAAGYGFDWPNAREVIAKVREETAEVEQSLAGEGIEAVAEEIGDLLFSVANLARHAGVDPEEALRRGTRKFERRFEAMARQLTSDGSTLASRELDAMEAAWQAVKRSEKA